MSLWWALPRFSAVEAWPGRGWLVEGDGGEIQFVHDLAARRPVGVAADNRFYDPPPVRRTPTNRTAAAGRVSSSGAGTTATRRRRPPAPRLAQVLEAQVFETLAPAIAALSDAEAERLPYANQPASARRRTSGRAETLLRSLLDSRQRAEWDSAHLFWVHGAFGSIRLGRMYRIVHRPLVRSDRERTLCVITRAHRRIPEEDEWTSMLLALAHEPHRFFRVANVMSEAAHVTDLAQLRDSLRGATAGRDAEHAIHVAGDIGTITGGRELVWAAELARRHAALDPSRAEDYLAHHRRVLERASEVAARLPAETIAQWLATTPDFPIHRGAPPMPRPDESTV